MDSRFRSAKDFRISLQQRIKNFAEENSQDVQEIMKKVAFDRLLSRFCSSSNPTWILKGGYALELLFDQSRTTKDIDLVLRGQRRRSVSEDESESMIKQELVQCIQTDLNDGFQFILQGKDHSLEKTLYGGHRYGIECQISGKRFVSFHVDISFNDISRSPFLKQLESENWLNFAGIAPQKLWSLAPEEIFAEKLHAYTLPRERENSRVRDIVDMYLLTSDTIGMEINRLKKSIDSVFRRRKTHALPKILQPPPASWDKIYPTVAKNCGLNQDLDTIFRHVKNYIDAHGFLNT